MDISSTIFRFQDNFKYLPDMTIKSYHCSIKSFFKKKEKYFNAFFHYQIVHLEVLFISVNT